MDDQLTWNDATAQAVLVREGAVSPLELVEAAIERIDRDDAITLLHKSLRKAA